MPVDQGDDWCLACLPGPASGVCPALFCLILTQHSGAPCHDTCAFSMSVTRRLRGLGAWSVFSPTAPRPLPRLCLVLAQHRDQYRPPKVSDPASTQVTPESSSNRFCWKNYCLKRPEKYHSPRVAVRRRGLGLVWGRVVGGSRRDLEDEMCCSDRQQTWTADRGRATWTHLSRPLSGPGESSVPP